MWNAQYLPSSFFTTTIWHSSRCQLWVTMALRALYGTWQIGHRPSLSAEPGPLPVFLHLAGVTSASVFTRGPFLRFPAFSLDFCLDVPGSFFITDLPDRWVVWTDCVEETFFTGCLRKSELFKEFLEAGWLWTIFPLWLPLCFEDALEAFPFDEALEFLDPCKKKTEHLNSRLNKSICL